MINLYNVRTLTIKYTLNQVANKNLGQNKFLTIFNEFYKIVNILQREAARVSNQAFTTAEKTHIKCITFLKTYNVKKRHAKRAWKKSKMEPNEP